MDSWINESFRTFEILIDLDHYWKLVTRNVIRGKDGPVALETRLGYVWKFQKNYSNRCGWGENL